MEIQWVDDVERRVEDETLTDTHAGRTLVGFTIFPPIRLDICVREGTPMHVALQTKATTREHASLAGVRRVRSLLSFRSEENRDMPTYAGTLRTT